ncbi:MAG TPA: hypothetical protein VGQ99_16530, partial [Tepidisphaeraceae bacterium]|nr:hypothetical protein [Tepidisphaeraceae bacterium]
KAVGFEEEGEKVKRVYELVLGRKPRAEEVEMAREFLDGAEEGGMTRWEQFAQVLLVCSEAIYVD